MQITGIYFNSDLDAWIVSIDSRCVGYANQPADAFRQLELELERIAARQVRKGAEYPQCARPHSSSIFCPRKYATTGPSA